MNGSRLIVEDASGWQVVLRDPDLTFIRIDHQTRLQFGDVAIVIETPFEVRRHGQVHALDPSVRTGLGPLLAVYPDEAVSATIGRDGTLHIGFTSGASVTVPPNEEYEAWGVVGPGTEQVVCRPGGGEPAIWR